MVYTEVKEKDGRKYYYRVKSVRKGDKILKERKYLGANLDKESLNKSENSADKELEYLSSLLDKKSIKFLEKLKKNYLKQPKESLENRYEAFCSQFTYNSTAIEGNTLTLQETAQLLFDNIVPSSKSLREINESLNHKKAFDYMLSYGEDITKRFILQLHGMVVKDTLKPELESQIGVYRNVQVFIRGSDWLPPKPKEVPSEIQTLLSWYTRSKIKLHPLILAAYFHVGFETIHPFIDGNGRVGRLLMNFILHKNRYPMINIPNSRKNEYYSALQEAQLRGNLKPFINLLLSIWEETRIMI